MITFAEFYEAGYDVLCLGVLFIVLLCVSFYLKIKDDK